MRTILFSLAAAASALAVASPASAQYYPAPGPQGYGVPGYGQGNFAHTRVLQQRVEQLRQRIHRFDRMNRLSNREARRLDGFAIGLQRRIAQASYRGVNPWERQDIERRIEGLQQAVRYAARDGNRRWGWNGRDRADNGYGYYGARDQRWERDDRDDRRGRDDDRRDRDDRWDRDDD